MPNQEEKNVIRAEGAGGNSAEKAAELLQQIQEIEAQLEEKKKRSEGRRQTVITVFVTYIVVIGLILMPVMITRNAGLSTDSVSCQVSYVHRDPASLSIMAPTGPDVYAFVSDFTVTNDGSVPFTYNINLKLSQADSSRTMGELYDDPILPADTVFSLAEATDRLCVGNGMSFDLAGLTGGKFARAEANTVYFATSADGENYAWHSAKLTGNSIGFSLPRVDGWERAVGVTEADAVQYYKVLVFIDLRDRAPLPQGAAFEDTDLLYQTTCRLAEDE